MSITSLAPAASTVNCSKAAAGMPATCDLTFFSLKPISRSRRYGSSVGCAMSTSVMPILLPLSASPLPRRLTGIWIEIGWSSTIPRSAR